MDLSLALLQMIGSIKKDESIKKADKMIRQASKNGANLIVLPEMWNCPYSSQYFKAYGESEKGKTFNFMASIAKEEGVYLVGGSIPEFADGKVFNTSFFFDPKGVLIGKHRKAHLFDIDIPGRVTFIESETLTAGDKTTVVDTKFGKIGLAICYDIRFPEIFRNMALLGAEIIVLPAAFSVPTGEAHWEISLRARALDNQVYLLACSPARDDDGVYQAYGSSAIIDPWGKIIEMAKTEETIVYGNIDLNRVEEVRSQLPLLKHRRPELYKLGDI